MQFQTLFRLSYLAINILIPILVSLSCMLSHHKICHSRRIEASTMRMQMYNVYMIIRYSQSADGRDWKPTIIYLIWILQFKHDLKILVFFCSKHETNLRIEKRHNVQIMRMSWKLSSILYCCRDLKMEAATTTTCYTYAQCQHFTNCMWAHLNVQYKNRAKMLHRINGQLVVAGGATSNFVDFWTRLHLSCFKLQ